MNLELLQRLDGVCLVGHPFAQMGMGEHIRCVGRSFQAIGARPKLFDIYRLNPRSDVTIAQELDGHLTDHLSDTLNVFHLNADEVEQALATLGPLPGSALNVIYPAWELPRYPSVSARLLERFDEIWAPSHFIHQSIAPAVSKPVIHMPLACELELKHFYGRRYFGIPESAFTFLYFFDFTSFVKRKNPFAVLDAFEAASKLRPNADMALVLKLNRGSLAKSDYATFLAELKTRRVRVVTIDETLGDEEMKNLVHNCDAFVSLHRSEGFGRGMSEAMFLGKPVIATGWSGNLDFMNPDVSCLVDYRLIPVKEGEYPHWENQVWADPNIQHAAAWMVRIVDEPKLADDIGVAASRHIRVHFSYRARGLAYASRIVELLDTPQPVNALLGCGG